MMGQNNCELPPALKRKAIKTAWYCHPADFCREVYDGDLDEFAEKVTQWYWRTVKRKAIPFVMRWPDGQYCLIEFDEIIPGVSAIEIDATVITTAYQHAISEQGYRPIKFPKRDVAA